jgi:hypothetical protein
MATDTGRAAHQEVGKADRVVSVRRALELQHR